LFDEICEVDEYYPTRTEFEILRSSIDEIAAEVGAGALVIEPGLGNGTKAELLLRGLEQPAGFVGIEISKSHLEQALESLSGTFDGLPVAGVCADFTESDHLPDVGVEASSRLVFFPGSTIGNFEPRVRQTVLRKFRSVAGDGGKLLIGIDLEKDPSVVKAAYNDSQGVTREFNKNLLRRMNSELDAGFELDSFTHQAVYDDEESRIEMQLVSQERQTVSVSGKEFVFEAGEHILTEYSHKFDQAEFEAEARLMGWQRVRSWTDARGYFSVVLFDAM
jgi:dimethylhistidine N-methyltransferase